MRGGIFILMQQTRCGFRTQDKMEKMPQDNIFGSGNEVFKEQISQNTVDFAKKNYLSAQMLSLSLMCANTFDFQKSLFLTANFAYNFIFLHKC